MQINSLVYNFVEQFFHLCLLKLFSEGCGINVIHKREIANDLIVRN